MSTPRKPSTSLPASSPSLHAYAVSCRTSWQQPGCAWDACFWGYMRHALTKRFKRFCSRNSHIYYPIDTYRHWMGTAIAVASKEISRLKHLQAQGAGTVNRS